MEQALIKPGIVLPLMPFLNERLNYDFNAVGRQVDHAIDDGIAGIFVLTTCGQASSFSLAENKDLVSAVKESVNGRIPIYVGIGRENDPLYTACMFDHAKRLEASAVVVLCYGMSDDKQLAYFQDLNEHDFPLIAYTLGSQDKRLQRVEDIIGLGNVAAAKATIDVRIPENEDYFRRVVGCSKPVFIGEDIALFDGLEFGAFGGINAIANLIPRAVTTLYARFIEGDTDTARFLQDRLNTLLDTLYYGTDATGRQIDGASALQNAMAQVFLYGSPVLRKPRVIYEGKDRELICQSLVDFGIIK